MNLLFVYVLECILKNFILLFMFGLFSISGLYVSMVNCKNVLRYFYDDSLFLNFNKYSVNLSTIEEIKESQSDVVFDLERNTAKLGRTFLCDKSERLGVCPLPTTSIIFHKIKNVENGVILKNNFGHCLTVKNQNGVNNLVFSDCLTGEDKKKHVFIFITPEDYEDEYERKFPDEFEEELEEEVEEAEEKPKNLEENEINFGLFFNITEEEQK